MFIAWVDSLYLQTAAFFMLFVCALVLIHPPAPIKPGVELKAEYMVVLTWPATNLDDIDLHMLLPDGQQVDFHQPQVGAVMLDHDDLGTNNYIHDGSGHYVSMGEHREMMTIRAIVPGRYVANVHVFRVNKTYAELTSTPLLPYKVHVVLMKLNPSVTQLCDADVELRHVGEQRTAFAFMLQDDGWATCDTDADAPFIKTRP